MSIEASIWLFNQRQCGYYKNRIFTATPAVFGNADSIFSDLIRWADGKALGETSTFDVPEDSNLQKTYLLHASRHRNGDFLIGVWNRVHSNSNKIASVGAADIVGAAAAQFTEIDPTRIPGLATYFWVLPAEQKIAAVRVKHMTNGLQSFEAYMQHFVRFINPRHVVLGAPNADGEIPIVGYKPDLTSTDVLDLYGKFECGSIRKTGDLDYIVNNRADLRRVICKATLTNTVREDRVWWQRGLSVLGMGIGQRVLTDPVSIKIDLPLTFTEDELRTTITEWQQNLAVATSSWDDLGFVFKGDQTPRWLSKSYARRVFDLDIDWIDDEQVEPTSLMNELQRNRAAVLQLG
ncbi:hypothetical protein BURK_001785 [Burkholderia sp. SJ98]|nr:hypothetical protein BURK_001785 [Burkholderia sp. SJ98]